MNGKKAKEARRKIIVESPEPKPQEGQIYLKLEHIFEADIMVRPNEPVQSFLLHMKDIGGTEFVCPLICPEEFKPGVRAMLGKLKPLAMQFDDPKVSGPAPVTKPKVPRKTVTGKPIH